MADVDPVEPATTVISCDPPPVEVIWLGSVDGQAVVLPGTVVVMADGLIVVVTGRAPVVTGRAPVVAGRAAVVGRGAAAVVAVTAAAATGPIGGATEDEVVVVRMTTVRVWAPVQPARRRAPTTDAVRSRRRRLMGTVRRPYREGMWTPQGHEPHVRLLLALLAVSLGSAGACSASPRRGGATTASQSTPTAVVALTVTTVAPTPTISTTPASTSTATATAPAKPPPLSPSAPAATTTTVTSVGSGAFVGTVATLAASDLPFSWRSGCPVGPTQLRLLHLSYWGFDSQSHVGTMVVNAAVTSDVLKIFARLFSQHFPIHQMQPVDIFHGSDPDSMAADNTSGFNCRYAVAPGPPQWSAHAYGEAIDVNTVENPYVTGATVMPPAGAAFVNRSPYRAGMAVAGGQLVQAFAAVGWQWGGRWSSPDYQHFSKSGG